MKKRHIVRVSAGFNAAPKIECTTCGEFIYKRKMTLTFWQKVVKDFRNKHPEIPQEECSRVPKVANHY